MNDSKFGVPLIGIAGGMGSGKTTAATYIQGKGWPEFQFAGVLKQMTAKLIGCNPQHLEDQGFKKKAIPHIGGLTPRYIMQTLGTEWGRNVLGQDFWINLLEHHIWRKIEADDARGRPTPGIVISDVRFKNEADWIHEMGGEVWLIVRGERAGEGGTHASEQEFNDLDEDRIFFNNGTKSELFDRIDRNIDKVSAHRQIRWCCK